MVAYSYILFNNILVQNSNAHNNMLEQSCNKYSNMLLYYCMQ